MSGEPGCPFGAGTSCPDCDGSCWHLGQEQPEPTADEYCEGTGHPPYGEDVIEGVTVARCYCGKSITPAVSS